MSEQENLFYDRPPSPSYRPIKNSISGLYYPVTAIKEDFSLVNPGQLAIQKFPSLQQLVNTPTADIISVCSIVYSGFGIHQQRTDVKEIGMVIPLSPRFAVSSGHSLYDRSNVLKAKDQKIWLDPRPLLKEHVSISRRTTTHVHVPVVNNLCIINDDDTDPAINKSITSKGDVGFTKLDESEPNSPFFLKWFVPYANDPQPKDPCWLIARHTLPKLKELEEANISMEDANILFSNFDLKCVSSGDILVANDRIICATLSCTHGASGGPLLVNQFSHNYFAGIFYVL